MLIEELDKRRQRVRRLIEEFRKSSRSPFPNWREDGEERARRRCGERARRKGSGAVELMAEKKEFRHKCELRLLVCEPSPLRPDRVTVGFVLRDDQW